MPLVHEVLMAVELDYVQWAAVGECPDGGIGDGVVSSDDHGQATAVQDRADALGDSVEVGGDGRRGDADISPVGHRHPTQDPPLLVKIVPAFGRAGVCSVAVCLAFLIPRVLPPR